MKKSKKRPHTDTAVPHAPATEKDTTAVSLRTPPAGDPNTRKHITKTRQARVRFAAVHAKGMKALKDHDYDALAKAIQEEGAIVDEVAKEFKASQRPRKASKKRKSP